MEQPARKYYTFADSLTWDEDDRIEIIYGDAYMMSAPLRDHQHISVKLVKIKITVLNDCLIELSAVFRKRIEKSPS